MVALQKTRPSHREKLRGSRARAAGGPCQQVLRDPSSVQTSPWTTALVLRAWMLAGAPAIPGIFKAAGWEEGQGRGQGIHQPSSRGCCWNCHSNFHSHPIGQNVANLAARRAKKQSLCSGWPCVTAVMEDGGSGYWGRQASSLGHHVGS